MITTTATVGYALLMACSYVVGALTLTRLRLAGRRQWPLPRRLLVLWVFLIAWIPLGSVVSAPLTSSWTLVLLIVPGCILGEIIVRTGLARGVLTRRAPNTPTVVEIDTGVVASVTSLPEAPEQPYLHISGRWPPESESTPQTPTISQWGWLPSPPTDGLVETVLPRMGWDRVSPWRSGAHGGAVCDVLPTGLIEQETS